MKTFIGIWVDRRKAIIITLQRELPIDRAYIQSIDRIDSGVEARVRLSGGSGTRGTPWGPQDIAVDGKSEARRQDQLKQYFGLIITKISEADRIIIMGPGETKTQLRKAVDKIRDLAARVEPVETVDKLTEKQIAARVRRFFSVRHYREAADA